MTPLPADRWRDYSEVAQTHGMPWSASWMTPISAVLALLAKFNAKTNLVGDATLDAVFGEHVWESLALATAVARVGTAPRSVVDVGAGAGLETLVLALAWPDCQFTVVEPRRKRADFIELAADRAGVGARVQVLRAQLSRHHCQHQHELATSRATFAPAKWLQVAPSLVVDGGLVALHARVGEHTVASGVALVEAQGVPGCDRQVALYRVQSQVHTAP